MDDDACRDILAGENVGVRHLCQCAEALKWRGATRVPVLRCTGIEKNVQCGQMCTAMPNHSRFAATAPFQLIILLTADPSRGPRSELSPNFGENSTFYVQSDQ